MRVQLVLIGLRGSGKTSIARLLAQRRGAPWIDLDDLTPTFVELDPPASSVRDAWERAGEAAFRDAEVRALTDLLSESPAACPHPARIIALGGGTPTAKRLPGPTPHAPIATSGASAESLLRDARDRDAIRIIYLRASPGVLRARLEASDHASRPSLTGANFLDEIPRIYARRDPLYAAIADQTVDVDDLSPEEVCDAIGRLC